MPTGTRKSRFDVSRPNAAGWQIAFRCWISSGSKLEFGRAGEHRDGSADEHGPLRVEAGHAGVRQVLESFIEGDNNLLQKMDIKHTTSSGDTVMNERLETWVVGNVTVKLPVVGLFAFNAEGKICRWHDYFDAETIAPLTAEMKRVRG